MDGHDSYRDEQEVHIVALWRKLSMAETEMTPPKYSSNITIPDREKIQ